MGIKLILLLSRSFPHDNYQAEEKVNGLFVHFPPSRWFPHVLASTADIFCLDFLVVAHPETFLSGEWILRLSHLKDFYQARWEVSISVFHKKKRQTSQKKGTLFVKLNFFFFLPVIILWPELQLWHSGHDLGGAAVHLEDGVDVLWLFTY